MHCMKPWFVYILRCSDGTLYTGVTNDLERRLDKHNQGRGAKYTRSRRPAKFLYFKKCESRSSALREESALKKLSRKNKMALVKRSRIESAEKPRSLSTKLFQVVNEGFVCDHCGAQVFASTCGTPRNHCPFCFFSKHVDIHVGDRANPCKGMLKPIGVIADSRKNYIIVHKCLKCGERMHSKAMPTKDIQPDNFELIIELSTHPIHQ